jgi:bifunctional UDP-N-acetylglucosamine pyrophosphorylase/glucosamine-1-phosphate N-acetyltransferase
MSTPAVSPTVLILAAGQGTRMHSATPKVLHELCGRPMVLWPVLAALDAGAAKVVVVDSPARALAQVLQESLAPALAQKVTLVVQPQSNGTGGAVIAAADEIDRRAPVVVLSGDVPLVSAQAIAQLIAAHTAASAPGDAAPGDVTHTAASAPGDPAPGNVTHTAASASGDAGHGAVLATMATTVLADPSGYGRVVRDAQGNVLRVVETKKDGDATPAELQIGEVNTGIYAFDGAALLDALPRLSADNAQGELYLPQVLDLLRSDGHAVAAHVVDDPGLVLGVNDRASLAHVRALAQRAINEQHMLAGVTIVDPASAEIDCDVQIGQDARIEQGTRLKGATTVAEGATVGPHTTVIDSHIGARARVRASWLEQATVHADASVGPFAYLRPGALLREGAKVGTFVEVKNSDIGAGAKVPHLSYIGDADVGEHSNLGAGTITANYDGRAKHRTTIGRRVKGGVDTALVAPVTVGDDAYTAAGSVITEDVPPGALGVARARQSNREGYAERREQE